MNIKILFLSFMVGLTLSGCGGASSGSSSASVQQQEQVSEGGNEPGSAEAEAAMDNLVASEEFEFINKNQIVVDLDLSAELANLGMLEQRSYVSIYGAYHELESGDYYVQNANRLLAGDLQDGYFQSLFTRFGEQQQYLVEVWFYNGQPPLQKLVMVQDNRLTW